MICYAISHYKIINFIANYLFVKYSNLHDNLSNSGGFTIRSEYLFKSMKNLRDSFYLHLGNLYNINR